MNAPDPTELSTASEQVRTALRSASQGLVERDIVIELVALGAVAKEHALIIGPPGTAKSAAVRRFAAAFEGRYFEYLLGRFTEPSEIFGPVDLRKLQEGRVETATDGMLPEAEVAFLDEVFLGSTAILNNLLTLINERVYRRGHTVVNCPLRVAVGASNALPDDRALDAFADRFLLRLFLDPIGDSLLEELLEQGWRAEEKPAEVAPLSAILTLGSQVPNVELTAARRDLAMALRELRSAGIVLSDRRAVKCQRLIAAAALLDGRTTATREDLWPLFFVVPTRAEQALAQDVLKDLLADSRNGAATHAAIEASLGALARAEDLVVRGQELLAMRPELRVSPQSLEWQLRIEGLGREIDATISPDQRPPALRDLRTEIASVLEENPASREAGSPNGHVDKPSAGV
ncbi:MAG: AAA family ATPase [Thermoanaerobaculia bacterium]|nr:AAA family ATPase [Thermoanaerobaculia bacterium]